MVVREEPDGSLVLVRQADHAILSGQVAALWGRPPWTVPALRDSVVLAARLHDLAWTPFDERLPRRPDGRPYAFFEVSRNITTGFLTRGIDAVAAMDGYAGLLCSLHFTGFYVSHWDWPRVAPLERLDPDESAAVSSFVAAEGLRQRRLRDRLGVDQAAERELACAYKWLQLWDRISLDVCRRRFDGWEGTYPPVPASAEPASAELELRIRLNPGRGCQLDPYPLLESPWASRVPAVTVAPGEDAGAAWRAGGAGGFEVTFA